MATALTLEELLIFNDELAGLVRAGIPLPQGFARFSADSSGRLKRLAAHLSEEMKNGRTLAEALGRAGNAVPKAYQSIVQVAEESGTLSSALESLSNVAKNLKELHRSLGRALWYPLLVAFFGYGMLIVFLSQGWHRFRMLHGSQTVPERHLQVMDELANSVGFWGWIPPAIVIAIIFWKHFQGDGNLFSLTGGTWMPGTRHLQREWRKVQFTRFLASQIRSQVPLATAIERAAELSGDRQIRDEAARLSESLRNGDLAQAVFPRRRGGIPGLVKWALFQDPCSGILAERLERISEGLQDRTLRAADRLRFIFPIASTVVLGGGMTLLYGWLMFSSLAKLWEGLSAP